MMRCRGPLRMSSLISPTSIPVPLMSLLMVCSLFFPAPSHPYFLLYFSAFLCFSASLLLVFSPSLLLSLHNFSTSLELWRSLSLQGLSHPFSTIISSLLYALISPLATPSIPCLASFTSPSPFNILINYSDQSERADDVVLKVCPSYTTLITHKYSLFVFYPSRLFHYLSSSNSLFPFNYL